MPLVYEKDCLPFCPCRIRKLVSTIPFCFLMQGRTASHCLRKPIQNGSTKISRLYPIVANTSIVENQERCAASSDAGRKHETIRLPHHGTKEICRSDDRTYNTLTVQNKSQDTIFLMSGDVVTGGNQDRVIAQDGAVMPWGHGAQY